MTIVRIVLADPRTGRPPEGSGVNGQLLVVLADTVPAQDGGHRAVPVWLPALDFKLLWWLLDRPARDALMAGVLEETAARLLHAAGAAVRVADEVMDRLAVPVQGDDVHAPFLLQAAVRPPGRPAALAGLFLHRRRPVRGPGVRGAHGISLA